MPPGRFRPITHGRCSIPTDKSSIGATQPDQIPLGRSGTIDELANLTIFAFSDACDYLTGETIAMDGGQRLAGPNTFAGLSAMSEDDWARARERSTKRLGRRQVCPLGVG